MGHAIPEHIYRILDLARWAPSGDNTQPWRFEILGDEHLLLHGFDTRDHVVYDRDGHASQLAVGAILETIAVAASTQGRRASIERRLDTPESHLLFDVCFTRDSSVASDPLATCIETRVVQRRPMSIRPLSAKQVHTLVAALPEGYQAIWFEGWAKRWRLARFMFDNAKVRLTIPEAYEVHSAVIEWGARFSEDRIPDQAVGVDPITARFMRWAMSSWKRIAFFNKYLFGDLPPRLQLDLLPGLLCGAHFALQAPKPLGGIDDFISAGRAMQRFWLVATQLGWLIQPEMTPVIFTRYFRRKLAFTKTSTALKRVEILNRQLVEIIGEPAVERLFFIGRIGAGPIPVARSTRKSVENLLLG